MVKYREIIRLGAEKYSMREIASRVGHSHHTIKDVLERASKNSLKWPLNEDVTDKELTEILYPNRKKSEYYAEPDYNYVHTELAKPGVTLTLLWTEYCEKCRHEGQTPYMSTQFGDKYRKWARITKATMRITHKPGDAMQVDWAGNTIPVHDNTMGETFAMYLFVAVLPCSCYAYAEACIDMKSENWLLSHVHAYDYFGGVTRLLIPDNLKTGVTTNTRYETILNRSYQELAEHYDTAIVPTRVKHPQDKGAVEGSVKYISTWIIAALRDRIFFTLEEVQAAVREKLKEYNDKPFQKREGSRRSAYLEEEQPYMQPLPHEAYEPAVWTKAKVGTEYLISDGKNRYSVPFDLIGETVDIRLTKNTVEIFYQGGRVASHKRMRVSQREPIIRTEHMPVKHQKYLGYTEDGIKNWANSVGENTVKVVSRFISSVKEPEQAQKSCVGLMKLSERYGNIKLESACQRALSYSETPALRSISIILKNDSGKSDAKPTDEIKFYGITRGAAYFTKGGKCND